METQTYIFKKDKFKSKSSVTSWLKKNNVDYKKIHETSTSFRARVKSPSKFKKDSFRTKKLSNGISIVVGKLKESKEHTNILTLNKSIFKSRKAVEKYLDENDLEYNKISEAPKFFRVVILNHDELFEEFSELVENYNTLFEEERNKVEEFLDGLEIEKFNYRTSDTRKLKEGLYNIHLAFVFRFNKKIDYDLLEVSDDFRYRFISSLENPMRDRMEKEVTGEDLVGIPSIGKSVKINIGKEFKDIETLDFRTFGTGIIIDKDIKVEI